MQISVEVTTVSLILRTMKVPGQHIFNQAILFKRVPYGKWKVLCSKFKIPLKSCDNINSNKP